MKKHDAKWKVAVAASKNMKNYKIKYYPTTLVVGADGKVVWHSFMKGEGTLDEAVAKAVKAAK
jgi:hypothetical protein